MARTYKRDSRGRFAGGGGGATRGKGTLAARTSLKRSRAKLEQAPSAAQRGAVTRGQNKLRTAQAESRTRLKGPSARFRPGRSKSATAPASNIRSTGGLPRRQPANARRATGKRLGLRANAIRTFNPKSPNAQADQAKRQMDRAASKISDAAKGLKSKFRDIKPLMDESRKLAERMGAKSMERRLSSRRIDREVAGMEMRIMGGRAGTRQIQRRAQRAAAAAARGSKAAARAREIYANQLAYMGTGKPASKVKSNIVPGPRNTQPPKPKRKRKPKQ